MKKTKKFLSVMLALLMIVSIIPMSSITASAANGVQEKINKILAVYPTGSYFTVSGKVYNSSGASGCYLANIPARGGLSSGAQAAAVMGNGYSCWAFSRYVFYNIFGTASYKSVGIADAKLGDIVEFNMGGDNRHYGIYLSHDSNYVYVYDSNYQDPPENKVVYNTKVAKSRVLSVRHASNYDSVNGSTPTPPIDLVTGLAGNYFLQNKGSGDWLSVSESKDASTQPINTWGTWWENFRVKLVASGNGYKINFPLVSSLLMNPYSDNPTVGTKINIYQDVNDITQWWGFEKVGDAYAIRCLYNTSLVLTDNGVNQATLTTYTGASNQLWYLIPYSYTVNYNANGGSGAPGSQTKYFNENLTLSSTKPTRSGYTFLGWSTSNTATSASYSAGSSFTTNADTTLYAVWKENVKTYTINYNALGGVGAPSSQTKVHGANLTLSSVEPTKDGYLFLGWTTGDMSTIEYLPGDTFIADTNATLYALWIELKELQLNDGWIESYDIVIMSLDIPAGSSVPYRAYYYVPKTTVNFVFTSSGTNDSKIYLYDKNGNQIGYDDDSGNGTNFRLECNLNAGEKYIFLLYNVGGSSLGFGRIYNIIYDVNGGVPVSSIYLSQEKKFFESVELEGPVPTRPGYTFLGWSEDKTATTATYHNGDYFDQDADITLYAVWQKDAVEPKVYASTTSVNLTLGSNGSTDVMFWVQSDVACQLRYEIGDANIVSCVWGSWNSENKLPLTITAKSKGITSITILLKDKNTGETLDSIVINVTVDAVSVTPEIHVDSTSVNLTLGEVENIDVYAWATDVTVEYTFRYAIKDTNIVSCAWGGWTSDNKCPLTITAKSKGTTTVTISLIDYNTQAVLDSVDVTVNVGVSEKHFDFSIKEPSRTTIRCKDGIILHANVEGTMPEGARIHWSADNNNFDGEYSEDGMQCLLISKNNGYTIITATIYDANDNVIATDSIEMRSKAGFFDKIGAFFRSLFGSTVVYEY